MLHNYTLVRASQERAADLKAAMQVEVSLDTGCTNTELGNHPDFGPLIVIDTVDGNSTIAVHRKASIELSNWLSNS